MTVAIVTHPSCILHAMGKSHPESPARLVSINQALQEASHIQEMMHNYQAKPVNLTHLQRVHDTDYLEMLQVKAQGLEDNIYWLNGDTAMIKHTLPAAALAAGAAVLAVELVLSGKEQSAFCAIRPPGHHAGRDFAMGFCLYNNVAIAAAHALEWGQLERIAIVDFDVHHGNGTEDIVANNEKILFCSSFQHPFYPYEGDDSKALNVCNLPLPEGTSGVYYRQLVTEIWLPRLNDFKPQLILISAGFDAHVDDPLGGLCFMEEDYAWITRQIREVAWRHAQGRIVSCLEGGYNLHALASSVVAHVEALAQ
ncbi:deacetylase [Achromatium sp. WMS2]|nr:deacetylase [Achromatium sp. WMS2]